MAQLFPAKAAPVLTALLLTGIMTFVVSAISTFVAGGGTPKWMQAWVLSWAVAFPVMLVVAPIVRQIVGKLVQPPPSPPLSR
jgi:membrane protein implicated in regulation of membrane protease activity